MKHYLYCSTGNTVGLDEFRGFYEIADDGYVSRYLETNAYGNALRYTEQAVSDQYGMLPEGHWNELEAAKPGYGTLNDISGALFDCAWNTTCCVNDATSN